ncbi:hypothetical protein JXA80_12935 [bacterium]|nr:hypothetical protein [candidate division CSSED10-310 bacterium]
MIGKKLTIDILSYWHISSGHGRGGDVDALVLKDTDGLPYLPGRTLKGLIREAVQLCVDNGHLDATTVATWFGSQGDGNESGRLVFDNAGLPSAEKTVLKATSAAELIDGLYETVAATRIDSDTGTAAKTSLRSMEVTVPMTLESIIYGPSDPDDWIDVLNMAVPLVRALGVNRHRGLGRCRMQLMDGGNDQ